MAATDKLDAFGQRIGVIDPKEGSSLSLPADMDADQKRLRNLIERRHPKYVERLDHWKFLECTYEGGREWFEANIFRYVKEGDQEFTERKKRAYRFNHTREVVDLLNKYLFSQPILRNEEDADECLKTFWAHATRNGLSMDDYSRQISKLSSVYGRIGIVVDNNVPAAPVSVAEAKKQGYGVYSYTVTPRQLLDYSFDDHGALNWALIEESYRDDENFMEEAKPVEPRWRLWTRNEWILLKEIVDPKNRKRRKIVVVDKGNHSLGVVPVILHDHIISDEEWCSSSLIDEIAYLDRAVANYLSNLDAIIQDQTFSQLAMPAQGLMPGEENYNKMLEMGTKRVFLYDGESGIPPNFISPDIKQAELIVKAINKIINEIYHTVGLAGERTKEDNAVGIDNSSGVAKAYDFERVNSLLNSKASALQVTEDKVAHLVCLWNGKTKADDKKSYVHYPKDFDTRSLYDEFDIAARLLLVEAPDELRREQMALIVEKLFPMASDATKKLLTEAIKKWPLDPVEMAAKMAEATVVTPASTSEGSKPVKNNRQGQVTKDTK